MKKILLLLTFAYINVFANELTITKSKTFVLNVEPDIIKSIFSFKINKTNYNDVDNELTKLSKILNNYDNICKSGAYTINKKYVWDATKNKNIYYGYEGSISSQCFYKSSIQFEKLLNEKLIYQLIKNQKEVSFYNSGSKWIISKPLLETKQKLLEFNAIKYSKTYAKELSATLNIRCTPVNIDLQHNDNQVVFETNRAMIKTNTPQLHNNISTKKDIQIKYKSDYKFRCADD